MVIHNKYSSLQKCSSHSFRGTLKRQKGTFQSFLEQLLLPVCCCVLVWLGMVLGGMAAIKICVISLLIKKSTALQNMQIYKMYSVRFYCIENMNIVDF